ncbi:MAG: phenylalanine--tRNA ligase subunit beta, partial [Bacteroidales bacterium]|nr:phenylalanine--tRNA ligase subunit beta [Bacteroidales bacterium]
MKISYNWLKDYININLQPEELADILTNIGLEVESVETFESIKGSLKGVYIGEVLTCEKHPNADKLTITTVNVGHENPLRIVCGAPNVAAGQKVPVAVVGTTLYKGNESFTLNKTKIRGEISEGMICAEDELGLGNNHSGIMVLDKNTIPGTPASDYFKISTDTIFEIGLTPNRTDAMCHIGVARDVAAFLSQTNGIKLNIPSVDKFITTENTYKIEVSIENTHSCPRYSGVSISGVTIKESPDWLKNKLKAIGLNPINNVVDITNFVLHETGQPLHAFDAEQINNRKIIVKNLPEGTPFITLDEVERKLSNEDLAICDGKGPVALAGVFGGLHSGVDSNTKNVFIESAHFNPATTRRTARRHQLSTDSSFRFERGVDPEGTIYAMKRAALLIQELAGGKISSDVVDVYPHKIERKKVTLLYSQVERLIGKKIENNTIKKIL